MKRLAVLTAAALLFPAAASEISTAGTRFLLDGRAFPYTGVSFFNAIYNPEFNRTPDARGRWLDKFHRYGINVLRIWAQWDNPRGFVDACTECSLYFSDGRLREDRVSALKAILADADSRRMVIELTLFSQESFRAGIRLNEEASETAVRRLTEELRPYRNLTIQIWNELSWHTVPLIKVVKGVDPKRLVTSSPGGAGVLTASGGETELLDYLTPHTSRQGAGQPWEIAPTEIRYLLRRYRKPVVDDEPARNGTPDFGGPRSETFPTDHILQAWAVVREGGYITYHHDMFQTGAGSKAVPPSGIPDPEFNPYHRAVFEFLANRERYLAQ